MIKPKSIAIVSNSFSGYLLASLLEQDQHSVTLVSTSSSASILDEYNNNFGNRIGAWPANELTKSSMALLQNYFVEKIAARDFVTQAITFEDEIAKPFVGFGENQSSSITCLSKFNQSQFFELNPQFLVDLQHLSLKTKPILLSELSGMSFVDSRLERITVNGSHEITADQFIFLNHPSEFINFIPPEYLGSKTRSRLTKSNAWTRISLNLKHESLDIEPGQLVFIPSTFADIPPCVGQFSRSFDSLVACDQSVWETYLDKNHSEDPEFLATQLKGLRRLIKKTFPKMVQSSNESINVRMLDSAEFGWILESKEFKEIADNLIISTTLAHEEFGLAQCIICVATALSQVKASVLRPEFSNNNSSLLEPESSH